MPLEHLELFPVLETDDIVRLYRRTDRNGWFLLHRRLFGGLAERGERPVDVLDDQRKVGNRDAVVADMGGDNIRGQRNQCLVHRSEEHTSELQSLMRISYAVFCLKKKKKR